MKKTVCVDLDGTLAHYEGWKGVGHIGEPRPGAAHFTHRLSEVARVVIFTTRTKVELDDRPEGFGSAELTALVAAWLDRHGFAYDEIYVGQGKPIAAAYLDDRAVAIRSNPEGEDYSLALLRIKDLVG